MIVALVILTVLALYVVFVFNKLVRLSNLVNEAWSGIDVQLQKRYDLIPTLVSTVKAYANHEKTLFEHLTQLRSKGIQANDIKTQEAAEIDLSKALGNLFVVVEAYPELKANQNFLDLQQELSKVENDLQRARRYYNGSVRNYNILIEQFPSMLVAKMLNHKQRTYFDISNETEKHAPKIAL
jgi:LemA protein